MSDIGDIDGEEIGEGVVPATPEDAAVVSEDIDVSEVGGVCLSCGATLAGIYCINCGQKQDDLRRSLFLLARNFIEDTFSFDGRMWRTLGLLAASPGYVPMRFSHGQRSQFTPPIRLFLIVSFLFFLTIGLTKTLFVGVDVKFQQTEQEALESVTETAKENGANLSEMSRVGCNFQALLRFLVKERDLETDKARIDECIGEARDTIKSEIEKAEHVRLGEEDGSNADIEVEIDDADAIVERVFGGINWAITNPGDFNDAFNDWLPRVMFFMTPILALILSIFLRRKALIFDHMVLSLYIHAVNFAIVGASLILTQLGMPLVGGAAVFGVAIYYVAALKRAYGRGWVKTLWTAAASAFVYMFIFSTILMAIISSVVWQATAG